MNQLKRCITESMCIWKNTMTGGDQAGTSECLAMHTCGFQREPKKQEETMTGEEKQLAVTEFFMVGKVDPTKIGLQTETFHSSEQDAVRRAEREVQRGGGEYLVLKAVKRIIGASQVIQLQKPPKPQK